MMIELLLYIKHKFYFFWKLIEYLNGFFVNVLWGKRIMASANDVLNTIELPNFEYRILYKGDLIKLFNFLQIQPEESFRYFKPHDFDLNTLKRLYKNPSFLMMGAFNNDNLIGYFFLRFFINKYAFSGRIVDYRYQGLGVGKYMRKSMFRICWNNDFRAFATVSKKNIKSLKSIETINDYKIIKELENDYVYLEYLKEKEI